MADLTKLKNKLRQDLAMLRQEMDEILFLGSTYLSHQDVIPRPKDLIKDWWTSKSEKVTKSFWKADESAL